MAAALRRLPSCLAVYQGCKIQQQYIKCASKIYLSSQVQESAVDESKALKLTQKPLEKQIHEAKNVTELFEISDKNTLTIAEAIRAIAILGKWKTDEKLNLDAVHGKKLEKICSVLEENMDVLITGTVLFLLKNLLVLNRPSEDHMVQLLENELLWRSRKMNFKSLTILLNYHINYQETKLQKQLNAEVVKKIENRHFEISNSQEVVVLFKNMKHFSEEFIGRLEDKATELSGKMSAEDSMKILCCLAEVKHRPKHVIRASYFNIINSQEQFSMKQIINLLYAVYTLNMPDANLLQKLSVNLLYELPKSESSTSVASLLRVLGLLRWRNRDLLQSVSDWIENNISKCNPQQLSSYIMAIAILNFKPLNADLITKILPSLNESDMPVPSAWLDFVWSLAVLNLVSVPQLQSVLKPEFVEKVITIDQQEFQSINYRIKLLNLNCLAKYGIVDYTGPFLSEVSLLSFLRDIVVIRNKDDEELHTILINTLNNFIPKEKYMCARKLTPAGVLIDTEFLVNKQGNPLPYVEFKNGDSNSNVSDATRIALIVLRFKDYCLSSKELTGFSTIGVELLKKLGYTVVMVPFSEFSSQTTVIKKVQYLQSLITEEIKIICS